MGLGICVYNTNVMNTVSHILPEVTDQDITVLFHGFKPWRDGSDGFGFKPGRRRNLRRCGGRYACKPVTEIFEKICDMADLLTVKDTEDGKSSVAAVTLMK